MRKTFQPGFTIVELLIVIVVIAILAAITVVAYSGIQGRAHDAAVQSDFRAAAQKLNIYKTDHGRYPTGYDESIITPELAEVGLSFSRNSYSTENGYNLIYLNNDGGSDFALVGLSRSGTTFYYSSREGSVKEYTGSLNFTDGTGGFNYELDMYESYIAYAYNYAEWASWVE